MTSLVWIIGRGGLLGSALERSMRRRSNTQLFVSDDRPWPWNDVSDVKSRITDAVSAFGDAAKNHASWEIHWAAGRGTMASTEADLSAETDILAHLLDCLKREASLKSRPGSFLFASTAGAIYGDLSVGVITENTPPSPKTAYGREKLKQETMLTDWTAAASSVSTLLARFSNLYGPGQSSKKNQGLITHIARSVLRHTPVNIFVPFDTIRDYIFVDDAAARVISLLQTLRVPGSARSLIIASEETTTIAHIIGVFRRITRLNPRIIRSTSVVASSYPRLVQFRSTIRSEELLQRTPLAIGIAETLAHERTALAKAS